MSRPRSARDEALAREFGGRVRTARLDAELTQERLAELAGVHPQLVGIVERGESAPTLTTLVALAEALRLDPAVLVAGLKRSRTASAGTDE